MKVQKKKVRGTKARPRLSVFRSNRYVYAQLIDDEKGKTLLGVSEAHLTNRTGPLTVRARNLGLLLAKKAKTKKITQAVFDRGPHAYHGAVRSLAEGAREGGLLF